MPTIHLIIKGDVQGVFYRASAREVAEELNIKGWIKNLADGNVEAIISGEEANVQEFIAWSRKGPRKANVEQVVIERQPEEANQFGEFKVIR